MKRCMYRNSQVFYVFFFQRANVYNNFMYITITSHITIKYQCIADVPDII